MRFVLGHVALLVCACRATHSSSGTRDATGPRAPVPALDASAVDAWSPPLDAGPPMVLTIRVINVGQTPLPIYTNPDSNEVMHTRKLRDHQICWTQDPATTGRRTRESSSGLVRWHFAATMPALAMAGSANPSSARSTSTSVDGLPVGRTTAPRSAQFAWCLSGPWSARPRTLSLRVRPTVQHAELQPTRHRLATRRGRATGYRNTMRSAAAAPRRRIVSLFLTPWTVVHRRRRERILPTIASAHHRPKKPSRPAEASTRRGSPEALQSSSELAAHGCRTFGGNRP